MRPVSPKAWSTRRKLLGNMIPIALSMPFAALAIAGMLRNERIFGPEFLLLCGFPVSAWALMNFFGLHQNRAIRAELARRFKLGPPGEGPERHFVGVARPAYRGLLDPHEDVGFLFLEPRRLLFRGDSMEIALERDAIRQIRFRPNAHSLVGLGRWVSVEGVVEGKPVRLLIEPRERRTLLGNLRASRTLRARLERWVEEPGPLDDRGAPADGAVRFA
jgi:hypothetical protein